MTNTLEWERLANTKLAALPVAGTTRHCSKCLFESLTFRYARRHFSPRSGRFFGGDERTLLPTNMYPARMIIVRGCPQCGAEMYERPADWVNPDA